MITLTTSAEMWPYTRPFHITGKTWTGVDVVLTEARRDGVVGRGEAAGIYFKDEHVNGLRAQIDALDPLPAASPRIALLERLPAGGARNAVDCALWELEARLARTPVWRLAGLDAVRPLTTTFTLGAETPAAVAANALSATRATSLKLKLTGDGQDSERVRQVRAARPDAWIAVDANQGFTRDSLDGLMSTLVDANVQLIEQPFPVGRENWLDGLNSPISLAADESVCDVPDLERIAGRVNYLNIKLDKCGGLTRGLALAAQARRLGLKIMVGNMGGTSLAMAPAFVLAQFCDFADLDGPTVLVEDRQPSAVYSDGKLYCPEEVWGGAG